MSFGGFRSLQLRLALRLILLHNGLDLRLHLFHRWNAGGVAVFNFDDVISELAFHQAAHSAFWQ